MFYRTTDKWLKIVNIHVRPLSNNSFRKPSSPPPVDRFEVVSPECVDDASLNSVKNSVKIILALRAPKRLWITHIDWVNGPYPSDIKIRYLPKKQIRTPLIQRLIYHRKQQKQKFIGRYRNDAKLLAEEWTIPIFEDELINQKVPFVA